MEFRKAVYSDIDEIVGVVRDGQKRLRSHGIDQWQRGYPDRRSIEADVASGVGMVLYDGDRVAAYGAVIFTGEPAYDAIAGGEWLTGAPYAVVHRLCVASSHLHCGCGTEFMRRVERFAYGRVSSIRIDTHPDNTIMQRLVKRMGFVYCGDVIIESRRLAYEKILPE